MVKFPLRLEGKSQLELVFRRAVARSVTGRHTVRIPQLPRLRQVVSDISRTPAGERVENIFRQVNMWTDESVSSTILPAGGAASLLSACAAEASALLELGYRREDGIDFITALPGPASNPVRSPQEVRAAVHHLGGDMRTLMEMMERPSPASPLLKVVFSVWPLGGRLPDAWRPGEETVSVHLETEGVAVPPVLTVSKGLQGYGLLCIWDLARAAAAYSHRTALRKSSFAVFADQFQTL